MGEQATGAGSALETNDTLSFAASDAVDPKLLEVFYKHYTDLFMYQARQRLDAIRFFFVGYAVLANALVSVASYPWAAFAISMISGIVSLIFLRLDYRNAQIVEIDEKPLKCLQSYTRTIIGSGEYWETFSRLDHKSGRQPLATYGTLVPALYGVFWASSFSTATFFLFRALNSMEENVQMDGPLLLTVIGAVVLLGIGLGATFWRRPAVTRMEFPQGSFKKGAEQPEATPPPPQP